VSEREGERGRGDLSVFGERFEEVGGCKFKMGYLRICEMSVTETVPSAARCMALLCAHCDIIT